EVPLEWAAKGEDEDVAEPTDGEGIDGAVNVSKAEERKLQDCMGRLNDGQQRSIKLAYVDGCTHEEIAARLGSPVGTVKSWVRRGLESLKRCLEAT
ncbi:MAG TPA: sigma factor-like helix-turn-helix DNA-binding protein, partial [Gammaproteobacteria bacterium]